MCFSGPEGRKPGFIIIVVVVVVIIRLFPPSVRSVHMDFFGFGLQGPSVFPLLVIYRYVDHLVCAHVASAWRFVVSVADGRSARSPLLCTSCSEVSGRKQRRQLGEGSMV